MPDIKITTETIRGLVRPYISLLLVSVVAYLAIIGKIEPGQILTPAGMIIAFHFGERKVLREEKPGG